MSTNFIQNAPLPSYEQLINCMHCGMCLPTCPTYELTKLEIHSPRGRIHMIRAVADGHLDITEKFKDSISFCLNCQACVTACPAGVEYGQLVESAQLQIAAIEKEKRGRSDLKDIILNWVFMDLRNLKFIAKLIRLYQRTGLEKLVQKSGILKIFSKKMHELSFMTPFVPKRKEYFIDTSVIKEKQKNIRVGVLMGCVQDVFFRDVNQDTLDVLKLNGFDVFIPSEDICCGSVHGHNGNLLMARELAKKLITIFENADVDYIILNSAGCGAYMKEYPELFKDDPLFSKRAKIFSQKVRDISELLVDHGWKKPEKVDNLRVTYHEPCHLVHTQKVSEQPREIITGIPGIEFYELPEATWCCGSAGIYNITRYEDSMKILKRKMKNIEATNANWVVTGNPGCMIQLIYGAKKYDVDVRVIHPVSLLKIAYEKEEEI
jgi:glycolate oxidase iron-sulfur subunit